MPTTLNAFPNQTYEINLKKKTEKKTYMVMLFTTVTHCLGPTAYVSSLLGFLWWTIVAKIHREKYFILSLLMVRIV